MNQYDVSTVIVIIIIIVRKAKLSDPKHYDCGAFGVAYVVAYENGFWFTLGFNASYDASVNQILVETATHIIK